VDIGNYRAFWLNSTRQSSAGSSQSGEEDTLPQDELAVGRLDAGILFADD
jgi:hypothetical protein